MMFSLGSVVTSRCSSPLQKKEQQIHIFEGPTLGLGLRHLIRKRLQNFLIGG